MTRDESALLALGILVGQSSSVAKHDAYLIGVQMMTEFLAVAALAAIIRNEGSGGRLYGPPPHVT